MEGGKALILFSALLATASACSCLLQSPQDKYRRERFVYTVFVLAKKAGIPDDSTPFPDVFGDVEFTVQIAGILRPTLDADEYIGATVGLATAAQSAACGVDLRVGEHYVVGGNLRSAPRGGATRSIDLCGTVVPISRDCVVPKCPKKCGLWTDGCRTYRCKNGRVRAVKKKGCKLSDQTARCLKLNFKEPEQCVICQDILPSCPQKCSKSCRVRPQTCSKCSFTECPKRRRRTFACDLFSRWNILEQRLCLAGKRDYYSLCCRSEHCCSRDVSKLPRNELYPLLGPKTKMRYCKRKVCGGYKCN
mmetsp:Transcript_3440/g.10435  ORF Transcript_3440/g.10435 Transcript_3440/m.10435 type:complete len:305 (+) Transcript_3440:289-1203(+)